MDLLTKQEDHRDQITAEFRFNLPLLANRLLLARQYVGKRYSPLISRWGLFGASTGAAAALMAASQHYRRHQRVVCGEEEEEEKESGDRHSLDCHAIVSRGGRVDLARSYFADIQSPVLLIVG